MSSPNDAHATTEAQVFAVVRAILAGRVLSYGAVGAQCHPPLSGYVCGRIMQNVPEDVPWWRIVGKAGNLPIRKRQPEMYLEQRRRLEAEGVGFDDDGCVLMAAYGN